MITIKNTGDICTDITIRHTPGDTDALLELFQLGTDYDGSDLENAIAVSTEQARQLHKALGAILITEDDNDLLCDMIDDFYEDSDPYADEADDTLEELTVTVTFR